MVELETILTPVSFNGGEPTRFFGLVQMLSDPTPLLGRAIAYERLIASQLIQEDEPLPDYDQTNLPPPPPPADDPKSHPKAPYLRLVVNQDHPAFPPSAPAICCRKCSISWAARGRQQRRISRASGSEFVKVRIQLRSASGLRRLRLAVGILGLRLRILVHGIVHRILVQDVAVDR